LEQVLITIKKPFIFNLEECFYLGNLAILVRFFFEVLFDVNRPYIHSMDGSASGLASGTASGSASGSAGNTASDSTGNKAGGSAGNSQRPPFLRVSSYDVIGPKITTHYDPITGITHRDYEAILFNYEHHLKNGKLSKEGEEYAYALKMLLRQRNISDHDEKLLETNTAVYDVAIL
jgi:hypothetical protein